MNATCWNFLILALQRLHDLNGTHVVGVHGVGIELHLDLTPIATDDVHATDARNGLEARCHHLVGQIRDLA